MDKRIQIGLVDDQNLFREGMKLVLSLFPELEIVLEADNGQQLLEKLAIGPIPDLILLDYTMPIMDGFETLQKVKIAYPNLKVIMLTMHFDEALMVHLMEHGANGYLLKDEQSTTVKEAILRVMETGQYFSHYVSQAMLKQLQNRLPNKTKPRQSDGYNFSRRELEILAIVGQFNRQEMADQLFISVKTVDFHLKNLRDKTQTSSTTELVRFAVQNAYQS